jgi:hypothetical protein
MWKRFHHKNDTELGGCDVRVNGGGADIPCEKELCAVGSEFGK